MAIEGIFYICAKVADLKRAKQFYGDTLGWKLNTDESAVAGFWFGSSYLVAHQDPSTGSEARHTDRLHVAVRVSDIDAEHARLKEHGVDVSPINERLWGERNFSFRDPDGHLWEYGQPK